ncbi:MAG: hypothetical protein WD004_08060 [Actinomycetota bacterium]
MSYLFLWTVIERYVSLVHGAGLKPEQKVSALGQDAGFGAALKSSVHREHEIVDTRNLNAYRLLPENPEDSAEYYYAVRGNVTHRGKGTHNDGETVRLALNDLLAITETLVTEVRTVSRRFWTEISGGQGGP